MQAKYGETSSSFIPVTFESEVARWTRGRSRGRSEPIEAVEVDGRPETVFVADQLLVDGRDRDLVNELVERYGAEVIPRKPLPPAPEGLGIRSGVVIEDRDLRLSGTAWGAPNYRKANRQPTTHEGR